MYICIFLTNTYQHIRSLYYCKLDNNFRQPHPGAGGLLIKHFTFNLMSKWQGANWSKLEWERSLETWIPCKLGRNFPGGGDFGRSELAGTVYLWDCWSAIWKEPLWQSSSQHLTSSILCFMLLSKFKGQNGKIKKKQQNRHIIHNGIHV